MNILYSILLPRVCSQLVFLFQVKSYSYIHELSCENCQESDPVMMLNVPLITIVNAIRQEAAYPTVLLRDLNSSINDGGGYPDNAFIYKEVKEILFEGFMTNTIRYGARG